VCTAARWLRVATHQVANFLAKPERPSSVPGLLGVALRAAVSAIGRRGKETETGDGSWEPDAQHHYEYEYGNPREREPNTSPARTTSSRQPSMSEV
jgi:hypothetical protein